MQHFVRGGNLTKSPGMFFFM